MAKSTRVEPNTVWRSHSGAEIVVQWVRGGRVAYNYKHGEQYESPPALTTRHFLAYFERLN